MESSSHKRVKELFGEALELRGEEREAFVRRMCDGDEAVEDELRSLLEYHDDERPFLGPEPPSVPHSPQPEQIGRYRIIGEIGRGGMGVVYEAEQDSPRRTVALKVLHSGLVSELGLRRFELEAEALGRLQHVGIAQIYDARTSVAEEGTLPYIAMELVHGPSIIEWVAEARLDDRERLSLLARVGDAIQHAHQRGIIHRDLKPGNILVDESGQPKILDFGIARVIDGNLDRTMATQTGQIIGTLAYMSPEQASGELDQVDTRCDVYALGALAYELLAGRRPHETTDVMLHEAVRRIVDDDPAALGKLRRDLHVDVVTIIHKAMEKEPGRRYSSAAEFALDLRCFLHSKPIQARPTTAIYQLNRFARRHKVLVGGVLATLSALVLGLISTLVFAFQSMENEAEAVEQEGIANRERRRAERKEEALRVENERFNRISVVVKLDNVESAKESLLPAWPDKAEALNDWLLDEGEPLADELEMVRKTLRELEATALPPAEVGRAAALDAHPVFANVVDGFLYASMSSAEERLLEFQSETGSLAQMRIRLEWAERLEQLTNDHPNARVTWSEVADAISEANGVSASELYSELRHPAHAARLEPQLGLVPIGMNPQTLLWEFYHLRSAWDPRTGVDPADIEIPTLSDDGSIPMNGEMGIVFVLIPGGLTTLGAQSGDPDGKNYDAQAKPGDSTREVTLEPFFLARHELTQGQWMRLSWEPNPCRYPADGIQGNGVGGFVTLAHPVEQVNWDMSSELLAAHGLLLPLQAQWEYACRAGTTSPWFTGLEAADLWLHANILDVTGKREGRWAGDQAAFDDGHVLHAPVGTYRPNAFGLHDTHGNVWEWCRDPFGTDGASRVIRGGNFIMDANRARSSRFDFGAPTIRMDYLGCRPSRAWL